MAGMASVRALDVVNTKLTPDQIPAFIVSLKLEENLTQVDVSGSALGEGVSALITGLPLGLFRLNLAKNRVNNVVALQIGEALSANLRSLVELNLNDNRIGNTGAVAIAEALEGNSSLMQLKLARNMIAVEGVLAFLALVRGLLAPSLNVVDLNDNLAASDAKATRALLELREMSEQHSTEDHQAELSFAMMRRVPPRDAGERRPAETHRLLPAAGPPPRTISLDIEAAADGTVDKPMSTARSVVESTAIATSPPPLARAGHALPSTHDHTNNIGDAPLLNMHTRGESGGDEGCLGNDVASHKGAPLTDIAPDRQSKRLSVGAPAQRVPFSPSYVRVGAELEVAPSQALNPTLTSGRGNTFSPRYCRIADEVLEGEVPKRPKRSLGFTSSDSSLELEESTTNDCVGGQARSRDNTAANPQVKVAVDRPVALQHGGPAAAINRQQAEAVSSEADLARRERMVAAMERDNVRRQAQLLAREDLVLAREAALR